MSTSAIIPDVNSRSTQLPSHAKRVGLNPKAHLATPQAGIDLTIELLNVIRTTGAVIVVTLHNRIICAAIRRTGVLARFNRHGYIRLINV